MYHVSRVKYQVRSARCDGCAGRDVRSAGCDVRGATCGVPCTLYVVPCTLLPSPQSQIPAPHSPTHPVTPLPLPHQRRADGPEGEAVFGVETLFEVDGGGGMGVEGGAGGVQAGLGCGVRRSLLE